VFLWGTFSSKQLNDHFLIPTNAVLAGLARQYLDKDTSAQG
jgi:hypothetical protein